MNMHEARECLEAKFGGRIGVLGDMLITLSFSQQPTDVTFYRRKPILDVKVTQSIAHALMYGAGAKELQNLFNYIEFSDGTAAAIGEIWAVLPMPVGGISQEELDGVDLTKGDERVGQQGETVRQTVRETYHCESAEQEEYFLRRWIAS